MSRSPVLALLLIGCDLVGDEPLLDPCVETVTPLAPDAPSAAGFSADDAVAWFGDDATIDVDWFGRHSAVPPHDTLGVTLGATTDILEYTYASDHGDADAPEEAFCALRTRLTFTRAASFATADGEVTGDGTLAFELRGLSMDAATLRGQAEVAVSASRQAEIDRETSDLDPPDLVMLYVYHEASFESAQIVAEGDGYGVAVWKCDEQHHPGCVTWR